MQLLTHRSCYLFVFPPKIPKRILLPLQCQSPSPNISITGTATLQLSSWQAGELHNSIQGLEASLKLSRAAASTPFVSRGLPQHASPAIVYEVNDHPGRQRLPTSKSKESSRVLPVSRVLQVVDWPAQSVSVRNAAQQNIPKQPYARTEILQNCLISPTDSFKCLTFADTTHSCRAQT